MKVLSWREKRGMTADEIADYKLEYKRFQRVKKYDTHGQLDMNPVLAHLLNIASYILATAIITFICSFITLGAFMFLMPVVLLSTLIVCIRGTRELSLMRKLRADGLV